MLEGITVLNSTDIYYCQNWTGYFPIGVFFGIMFVLISVAAFNNHCDTAGAIIGSIGLVSIALSIIAGIISQYTTTFDHTEYDVTVSESVSFEDFTDRYEIIDQKGKIYTIKERYQSNEIQK